MSKVSDIYDGLVTALDTVLTGYTRIADPYTVDLNSELINQKAYGIEFGPTANTNRFTSCALMTLSQEFNIILINKLFVRDNDRLGHDNAYKAIMEDYITASKEICRQVVVGASFDTVQVSASGIEFLEPAGDSALSRYISLTITVNSEFRETVS